MRRLWIKIDDNAYALHDLGLRIRLSVHPDSHAAIEIKNDFDEETDEIWMPNKRAAIKWTEAYCDYMEKMYREIDAQMDAEIEAELDEELDAMDED